MVRSKLSDVVHKEINGKPLCGAKIREDRLVYVPVAEFEASETQTGCRNCEEVAET